MALASEARHNRKTTEENSWFNPENLLLLATAEASQTLAKFDGIKKTRNFNQNNKTSMKISTFILALVHWPPFLQRLYGDLQKKTFCSTSVKIKLLSVFFFLLSLHITIKEAFMKCNFHFSLFDFNQKFQKFNSTLISTKLSLAISFIYKSSQPNILLKTSILMFRH